MSRQTNQPYGTQARPAFAPLQNTNSHSSSYSSTSSSTSSLTSQNSTSAPLNSPTTAQQPMFSSMNQQAQQQQPQGPQRHPSFEYRPNRDGAGQTAAETTNYLNQMALLNEAAKRAQLAVVMRDLDGMEL